ncbi:MAG: hypothetical protein FJ098_09215, partial [Deltaproteobacteria bacterium]|nr:hypothetical protein [Deltaproteobacteria bacterium]
MHRPRLYFLCAALVLVGFAPCCGGTKPGGPGADAGEGDTLFGRDALPDLVPEDSMPGDHRGEGPVDWVLPEGLGEVPPGELAPDGWAIVPCTEHTDCPEGFCVENPPGSGTSICAPLCEGGCPPGWECASVSISGPDPVDVCLPPQDMLCRSCKTDGDCLYAGALCILGGQPKGFCGRACVEGGEACPEGFGCQLVADAQGQPLAWQCLPVPGSCCAGGKWVDCDDKNPCT